jgi:hypothetical protein
VRVVRIRTQCQAEDPMAQANDPEFTAAHPKQRWIADINHVDT